MPRPTKRTPETVERIMAALRVGNTRTAAWEAAGISHETWAQWLHIPEFAEAVKTAESERLDESLARIREAGKGGALIRETVTVTERRDGTVTTVTDRQYTRPEWQADAWYAERRYPDDWGRRERHEVSGAKGGPVQVQVVYSDAPVKAGGEDAVSLDSS